MTVTPLLPLLFSSWVNLTQDCWATDPPLRVTWVYTQLPHRYALRLLPYHTVTHSNNFDSLSFTGRPNWHSRLHPSTFPAYYFINWQCLMGATHKKIIYNQSQSIRLHAAELSSGTLSPWWQKLLRLLFTLLRKRFANLYGVTTREVGSLKFC